MIILPVQLIEAAGAESRDFERAAIGLTSSYKTNLPPTPVEAEALKKIMSNPQQKLTKLSEGNRISPELQRAGRSADDHPGLASVAFPIYPQQPDSNCRRW